MHACLTVHLPDRAAVVRMLAPGETLRIGRGVDCGLRIDHPSISRAHAQLQHRHGAWELSELGSKNGSFVGGHRIAAGADHVLAHADWIRLGDVYCEFAPLDDAGAARAEAGRAARRAAATAHTARLDGAHGLDELLDASLRGVLELAQCERGFVLLQAGEGFAVRASLALDAQRLASPEFSGSVGAVRRALATGASVIANDIESEAWLSSRASVAAAGLSALVCIPLFDGAQPLGAIYADRIRPGPPVTVLDQELLEAFAERAALWITARRTSDLLAAHAPLPGAAADWNSIVAAHDAEAR